MTQPAPVDLRQLRVVQRILKDIPPEILYHYTDRRGLLGIFEKGEIWASDARYLNDAQELSTAITRAKEFVASKKDPTDERERRLIAAITGFLDAIGQPGLGPHISVFVFSCSEDGDQLSQWRAYSSASDGYAVGFSTMDLSNVLGEARFYLARCEYENERHLELIGECWEDARDTLLRAEDPEQAHLPALNVFLASFNLVAPIIKHRKFSEEGEWRFIRPASWLGDTALTFRDGGSLLIPYLPVPVREPKLPIRFIRIAPTPHQVLEVQAVGGLMRKYNIAGEIKSSDIPYRETRRRR